MPSVSIITSSFLVPYSQSQTLLRCALILGPPFPTSVFSSLARKTCIIAIVDVATKVTLYEPHQHHRHTSLDSPTTYHSKAANTAPAFAAEHTCPKHTRSPKNTASARNPANQKTIVTASTPSSANLWCARVSEKHQGTRMR